MSTVDPDVAVELVAFLGLTGRTGPAADRALNFRNGVLYPYTADLRRVYDRYVDVTEACPAAAPILLGRRPSTPIAFDGDDDVVLGTLTRYLAAVEELHRRTDFAGRDEVVGAAGTAVRAAISQARWGRPAA